MLERCAGVVIPLFSIRTERNPRRGEIPDLMRFAELAIACGHRAIQLLPFTENAPGDASPYNAISVFAIDPLYVAASEATRSRSSRQALYPAKARGLTEAFKEFHRRGAASEREAFEEFTGTNRAWLEDYVLFRALKERFDWASWEEWPPGLRARELTELSAVRAEMAEQLEMYRYWQYLARIQWNEVRAAFKSLGLVIGGDLAFMPARDSADVWSNQHLFDLSRSVGAPPDSFSVSGQRWGLPTPRWDRMCEQNFEWWRMRVREARSLYDFFRIDHVVGFYRTFSFPADPEAQGDFSPAEESEQLQQGETILSLIKEEAGDCSVIAEDLGTIPPWVRESLSRLAIAGFKVMRWEKEGWGTESEHFVAPSNYPELAVATTSTHDTTTLAGWWRECGSDERRGLLDALEATTRIDPTREELTAAGIELILRALYRSPARIVLVPIQDLFGWTRRINLPGSISDLNWSWRLPATIERMLASPRIRTRLARLKVMVEESRR